MSGFVTTTCPAARTADRIGAGVAVVRRGDDREAGRGRERTELGHLVLAERLGREHEQRPCGGVLRDRLECGHRVAQALAGGRRGDDHDVLARVDRLDRLGLMDIEPVDAARRQARHDPAVDPRGHRGVLGRPRRDDLVVDDTAGERGFLEEAGEDGGGVGGGVRAHHRLPT
jgi:hypothetical protein